MVQIVVVHYPHEKHGNAGKVSNYAKPSIMDAFLSFTNQPNGRSADSHSPTHYFISKFRTIQTPKRMLLTIRSECKLLWLGSSAGLGGNRYSLVVLIDQQPTGFTLTGQKWPFVLTNRIIVTSVQNSMLKFMPSVQP